VSAAPLADRHLVLVGMMGVGKSTVGRSLAAALDRPLRDSDAMIEEQTGRTVREIWIADGEPAYRRIESDVLVDALADPTCSVIAAAGGVVLSPTNREALAAPSSFVVWLIADVDVLVDRVRAAGHRPLLDDDPEATLRRLEAERAGLYREVADAVVSVDRRSVNEVTKAVLRCIA
jgi:shikimate kinase